MAQSVQAVNGTGYNSSGGAVSNHSTNITIGAGANRKLVVAITKEAAQTITGLTFDGNSFLANVAVTVTHTLSTTLSITTYYYDIPDAKATGTYAVVATSSAATANVSMYVWQTVQSATGAPAATASAEASEVSTTPVLVTVDIAASAGDLLLACFSHSSGAITWDTYSAPITERNEQNETNYTSACADGVQGTGGTKTVSCTASAASSGYNKIVAVVSVAEASAASFSAGDDYELWLPVPSPW